MRLALSVLAAAVAVAAGAGCGENKQASTTNWVTQVNAACKPWQKRIDAVRPAPVNTASLQKWLKRALPLIHEQVAAVRAVQLPAQAADATKATRFVDGLETTERALVRYLAAIKANERAKARKALADANASGPATRADALSLHITGCGGSSG